MAHTHTEIDHMPDIYHTHTGVDMLMFIVSTETDKSVGVSINNKRRT
jgi:hypothetical protein